MALATWPARAERFRLKTRHGLSDAAIIALYARDHLWRRAAA